MNGEFVDTDVIIRLITGDDLRKQAAAEALFQRVEERTLSLRAPDTVIADAVFLLASPRLYALARELVRDKLAHLVRLPGFLIHNRRLLLRAVGHLRDDQPRLRRRDDRGDHGEAPRDVPFLLRP
jgi:predicted nucleic acid-binding protein